MEYTHYNKNKQRLTRADLESVNGISKSLFLSFSEEELIQRGIIPVVADPKPDSRYYISTPVINPQNNVCYVTYNIQERDLESVKNRMKAELSKTFKKIIERPRVDTGLGFEVDGGYNDRINFEIGKKFQLPNVKDADGQFHQVTIADYDTIISAIEAKGIELYQTKWTKEQEIDALTDINACKLYEATPYTVEETDENGNTIIVTKYKNNVTEW